MSDHALPPLIFAFAVRAQVGPALELGTTRSGRRRIVSILGGTFEGPGLRGRILPGGADWQIVHPDGFTELDTRYTLETEEGALVYVQNGGVRHSSPEVMSRLLAGDVIDPSLVYFRTRPTFETAAASLQHLVRDIFIGVGQRYPTEVVIHFWRVG